VCQVEVAIFKQGHVGARARGFTYRKGEVVVVAKSARGVPSEPGKRGGGLRRRPINDGVLPEEAIEKGRG